ncbi:hypothetical protein [Mycoplasmopsis cynos]
MKFPILLNTSLYFLIFSLQSFGNTSEMLFTSVLSFNFSLNLSLADFSALGFSWTLGYSNLSIFDLTSSSFVLIWSSSLSKLLKSSIVLKPEALAFKVAFAFAFLSG